MSVGLNPADDRTALIHWIDDEDRIASDKIRAHAIRVIEDACEAFTASDSTFEAAAKIRVLGAVRNMLDGGSSIDEIRNNVVRRAHNGARFPRRSTEVTSNLMHQLVVAAWAEVAEWLGGPS